MDQAGLTSTEAKKRLAKFGPNELEAKKRLGDVEILLNQFKSPLIYILLIAMVITGVFLNDIEDTVVIGLAVGFNTILGWFQERKADRSLEALAAVLKPRAKIKRDGLWRKIETRLVVPGDVCQLEQGSRIPADGRMVAANSLSINEAVLTGESASVNKDVGGEVFMGTVVASGIGEMVVETTGMATRFGKIAASLTETREEATPLQRQLNRLARVLAVIVLSISVLVAVVGLVKGISLKEIFPTAVALAVASIPEGLAVALTVILAIGMQRILKRKALVRKLVAAETLGGVTVICCDKTGTLTEGKMKVVNALTDDQSRLRQAAILCNDLRDPLEIAMMDWALSLPGKGEKKLPRLAGLPFDYKKKYIATLHPGLLLVSGAPEIILQKSTGVNTKSWLKRFAVEADKGHRLVGFAYKPSQAETVVDSDINNLHWLGALVYQDPIRAGVKDALDKARQAGIKIKLITGDFKATAEAIAAQVGISPGDVYSRVSPEQKLKIVAELQNRGEVVAMTGDGVNDAPALKKADIGIVVSDASDVSKETADMVLLDDNFATILAAVAEGRLIRDNLKKVILYLLADSFAEIIIVVLSLIAGVPLAVTAGMILWINLISDGFPNLALTIEPAEGDLLDQPPYRGRSWLIDKKMVWLIGLISGLSAVMAFAAYWYYFQHPGYGLIHARSVAFSILGLNSLVYVWSVRALHRPLWQVRLNRNWWLVLAVAAGLLLQLLGLYSAWGQRFLGTVAIDGREWLMIVSLSLLMLLTIEGVKWKFSHDK
ncbi:MAG: HAD-IC family P-type ATPase [Candidatus Beckwithbacteria bacterium]|nr:HAD-IC family P-type ATPase [Candidatus Beckwithbacteria bacterium]